jgi:hypothetical protein
MGWWLVIEGMVTQLGIVISINSMEIFYLIPICTPHFPTQELKMIIMLMLMGSYKVKPTRLKT